jgi:hypothetical protein
MSPEEYLERAEHYRKAAEETHVGSFARFHLETMERSYRTLAQSEAALLSSVKRAEALAKLEPKQEQAALKPGTDRI